MADLGESLELNLRINKAIADRSVLLRDQSQVLGIQIELARELCLALECEANDFAGSLERIAYNSQLSSIEINRLTQSSSQLDSSLSGVIDTTTSLSKAQQDSAKKLILWNAAFNFSKSILSKFQITTNSVIKLMFNLGKSFFNVAKGILSIPFHVMKGLLGMAKELGKVGPLQQALEEVRDKFGDLREGTASLLKDSLAPMRKQFNEFADTGHSFAKTFGHGREGMAVALAFNAETMDALGGAAVSLRGQLEKSMGKLAIYQKGLGMTAQQQATLLQTSMASKRPIEELQLEMGHYAVEMSKKFGDNSKVVGKAMAEMRDDVANFGTLSTKQLAQVAIYTRKLGIETKALQGVINKYDNFEDAARSASMLNQTFGMQVDVMKLMREEDPAARLNDLQKSFAATGKSYDRLSRVERKRLADLAGLDEKSAMLAFSQNGLSTSYEEIQAAGDKSEDTIKDTNKVLKELSQNIKKIFKDYDGPASFFGAFIKGFQDGISYSPKFMALMRALNRSLFSVELMGRRVGRAFVETFPGAADAIVGLTKVFSPEAMGKKLTTILKAFKEFFNAIKGEPEEIRKYFFKMFNDIEGGFKKFFSGNSKNTSMFAQGVDKMLTAIGNIGIVFAEKIIMMASDFIPKLTEGLIRFNSGQLFQKGIVGSLFGDPMRKRFGENIDHLMNTIENQFLPAVKGMMPHLLTAMGKLMSIMKQWIADNAETVASFIITSMVETVCALWPVFKEIVKQVFKSDTLIDDAILFAWLGVPLLKFGLNIVQVIPNIKAFFGLFKGSSALFSGFGKSIGSLGAKLSTGPLAIFIAIADAAYNVGKAIDRVSKENVDQFGMQASRAGATISGLISALTFGLLPNSVMDSISSFFAEFFGGGEQRGFIGVLKENLAFVISIIGDTLQGIWQLVEGLWDIVWGILTFDKETIYGGLVKVGGAIINWFLDMADHIAITLTRAIARMFFFIPGVEEKMQDVANSLEQGMLDRAAQHDAILADLDKGKNERLAAAQAEKNPTATASISNADSQKAAKQEAEKKLDSLQEMKRLTERIKELSSVEKELDEVIKSIPTDEKINELRAKTVLLVGGLNKVTDMLAQELKNIKPNEMSTTDMLGEKLSGNFKGLNEILSSIIALSTSSAMNTKVLGRKLADFKDALVFIEIFMRYSSTDFKRIAASFQDSGFDSLVILTKGLVDTQKSLRDFTKSNVDNEKLKKSFNNLAASIKVIKTAFIDSENNIVKSLAEIKDINYDTTGLSKAGDVFSSFKLMSDSIPKISGKIIDSKISNFESSIKSVTSKIKILKDLETKLEQQFTGEQLVSVSPLESSAGTGYFSNFVSFTQGFAGAINNIPQGAAKKVEGLLGEMKKIKQSLVDAQYDPDLDMVIDLSDFKKHSNVTFHHKNIEFNVNVNVCMDAEELTTKIVQTKTKDKKMISTYDPRR